MSPFTAGAETPSAQAQSLNHWMIDWTREQIDDREVFENPLGKADDDELRDGIRKIAQALNVPIEDIEKAAEVAKDGLGFYRSSKEPSTDENRDGLVKLSEDEKKSLVEEREKLFSQKGMFVIISTVSLAAFLQGHVQSSINAGSLFAETVDLHLQGGEGDGPSNLTFNGEWKLGAMNASPFFAAAVIGAPLSLPVNYCIGRRGALGLSAVLIIASSLGSAFSTTWIQVLGTRIIGGVGMGIKAVSAPILASETAVGYWRGSTILAWQLWVACGIMIGFVVNLVIAAATESLNSNTGGRDGSERYLAFQLILGAPVVPGFLLLVAVCFCYESPRFYMRPNTPNYSVDRAFKILQTVRKTELQALRDLLIMWWPNRMANHKYTLLDSGLTYAGRVRAILRLSASQYLTLLSKRHLRNAVWSTCTVALAQQLCGINVFAFYSNTMFGGYGVKKSMLYSFGYGAVNFGFALPAMRSIDIMGRRPWLLLTLPLMSAFLMASAVAFSIEDPDKASIANVSPSIPGIVFIFLFAAAYSPGLGPIPFTLASESFPLSHREAGASVAIAINLLFAGLLTILLPTINRAFDIKGTLGFFSGMNIIAFILVSCLVQETKGRNLEDLADVFDKPKRLFIQYEIMHQMPYFVKKYLFFQNGVAEPFSYAAFLKERENKAQAKIARIR